MNPNNIDMSKATMIPLTGENAAAVMNLLKTLGVNVPVVEVAPKASDEEALLAAKMVKLSDEILADLDNGIGVLDLLKSDFERIKGLIGEGRYEEANEAYGDIPEEVTEATATFLDVVRDVMSSLDDEDEVEQVAEVKADLPAGFKDIFEKLGITSLLGATEVECDCPACRPLN